MDTENIFSIPVSCLNHNDSNILMFDAEDSTIDPIQWCNENKNNLEKALLKHGGVLLRNFKINAVSEFNRFAQSFSPNLLDYVYRSTPRTRLGGNIFTATEYPADQIIPLHNENSYSLSWPNKIMFFCAIPARKNGATPVADSRRVLNHIDQEVIDKFENKKVLYVRNYTPGIDLSWQEVFQTTDKNLVEKYCQDHFIQHEWLSNSPELRTQQICQATLKHAVTGEQVWFNQAHLFHVSSLPIQIQTALINELGENNLPRNAFYGDGTPLEPDVLDHIREAYAKETIIFDWQRGDIMILDNVLMAHGRTAYEGERKIAVAIL